MSALSNSAIVLQDVTVRLGGRTVLEALDLELPPGRLTAVMGPSGAGKTTILRLITGQLKPDTGQVWIGSVREHTDLPETVVRRIVLMKLEMVGLRGAAGMYPRELSGGMNRRVATARAMALDPDIMLYDEPFAGLDPISLGVSLRLIRDINRALETTSVVITHDVREVARMADFACIVADRRLIAAGSPDELAASDDALVRQFMDGLPDGPVPFHFPAAALADELLHSGGQM